VRETDYANDVTETMAHSVSTSFDADTGDRLRRGVRLAALSLAVIFVLVLGIRLWHSFELSRETERALSEPARVDVVEVKSSETTQGLTLPGQTAAWYSSTIYARVNGYVGKWVVDIGDHVRKGELLATIETPEL